MCVCMCVGVRVVISLPAGPPIVTSHRCHQAALRRIVLEALFFLLLSLFSEAPGSPKPGMFSFSFVAVASSLSETLHCSSSSSTTSTTNLSLSLSLSEHIPRSLDKTHLAKALGTPSRPAPSPPRLLVCCVCCPRSAHVFRACVSYEGSWKR